MSWTSAAAAALLAASLPAASVSGTIYLIQSPARRPAPGVKVTARAAGGKLLGSTRTDPSGRYRFAPLPPGRVTLAAARPGYFARAVAAGEKNLIVDLTATQELAGADFEIEAGGVITGRLTDSFGDPLEKIPVTIHRVVDADSGHRDFTTTAITDDRGIYRAFGLEPGRYILMAVPHSMSDADAHRAPIYYPGTTDETRAAEIEVKAAAEITGIDLAVRPEPAFRIAGQVVGPAAEEMGRTSLRVAALKSNRDGGPSFGMPVESDGRFRTPALPAGTYIVSAFIREPGPSGMARSMVRQVVDLRADIAELALRPGPPGQITGRIVFTPGDASRPKPAELRLGAIDPTFHQRVGTIARAPDYRFHFSALWAGRYRLATDSPGTYLLQAPEVDVAEGGSTEIELRVGLNMGRLTGLVKAPGRGSPLAHARVAVAKAGASPLEIRTTQTDQNGRFVLPDLAPGEYQVCAWPRMETLSLYASLTWKRAGAAVKRFAVEAGAQVEVELTAAP